MIIRRIEHDLGNDRLLTVLLPEGYDGGDREYPLLLCLDAQWTLGTVSDTALILGLARLVPRVIVAGLGWRCTEVRDIVVARSYAYTPTADTFPPEVVPPADRVLVAGGGPAFLEDLADAVLPLLARTYRLAPRGRTLIGHSLSGLFGLYTASVRPALFDGYVLASPSVWWHDRVILSWLRESRDVAGRLYVTMGEGERVIAGCAMIDTAHAAAALLGARNPGLVTRFDVLPGEIHQSTIAPSVTRGLRWVFGEG
ncbi:MAG: alpha/beta hydrolase [Gammaproteobacteria bacterium]